MIKRNITLASAIHGWMGEEGLLWLAAVASKKSRVVEIGCWKGRSTRAIGDNVGGVVYAVDHFRGSIGEESVHGEAHVDNGDVLALEFYANNFDLIQAGKVIPIRADSNLVFEKIGHQIKPDMVFLDGGHTKEEVKRDILTWGSIVPHDGRLCGHDHSWQSVRDALQECGVSYEMAPGDIWVRR